jgi:septum formation protein
MRLVLASASPRRAELLRAAGFTFDTLVVDVDERVRDGEAPADYVRRLAMEKSARAVSAVSGVSGFSRTVKGPPKGGHYDSNDYDSNDYDSNDYDSNDYDSNDVVIMGADTAVVVDGHILGKPRDDEEARAMLRQLSGRAHEVLTGVSVRWTAGEAGGVETTKVWIRPLTDDELSWYIESGEGRDKAGAYAIQGLASRFIPKIDGSYSNVVGLPVARVAELLREMRLLGRFP